MMICSLCIQKDDTSAYKKSMNSILLLYIKTETDSHLQSLDS